MRLSKAIALFALLAFGGCEDADTNGDTTARDNVIAISWQPAFCENARRKRECRQQLPGRFDVTHFSLHGLWPQPGSNSYCDVPDAAQRLDKARRWRDLPLVDLSQGLARALDRAMPGRASYLDRHEWVKHGTCYSNSAERYFADSLKVMDWLNASFVRALFVGAIGETLRGHDIRQAFDQAFGAGAGDRVRISCRQDGARQLIVELTIGLRGDIGAADDLSQLILAAPKTRPGCPGGIVDPVGFQ